MTERKLASIQRILDIKPIPDADAIEVATVQGWQVVVKKNDFRVGDLCVFFEIDSVLPMRPEYEFLTKSCYRHADWLPAGEGYRLRTIKLRKQLSQGLVLSFGIIPSTAYADLKEGDDVTELLGVVKWDPPLAACLAGQAKGYFPPFLQKSDQERVQNLRGAIEEVRSQDHEFEVTIKMHGSSCTTYIKDGEVGICSRNLELKINDANADNSFIRAARQTGLFDALRAYDKNMSVVAELMGPGIHQNRENLKDVQLFVFDIFNIDRQEYLSPVDRLHVFNQLRQKGFVGEHVPILHERVKLPDGEIVPALLQMAEGPSLNHLVREGVVWKSHHTQFSFKAISNSFLMKEKE